MRAGLDILTSPSSPLHPSPSCPVPRKLTPMTASADFRTPGFSLGSVNYGPRQVIRGQKESLASSSLAHCRLAKSFSERLQLLENTLIHAVLFLGSSAPAYMQETRKHKETNGILDGHCCPDYRYSSRNLASSSPGSENDL